MYGRKKKIVEYFLQDGRSTWPVEPSISYTPQAPLAHTQINAAEGIELLQYVSIS